TIYNPAPAKEIDDSVIKKIDYLLLNETEMEEIFKISVSDKNYKDKILELKKEKGLKNIILTLGENGSVSFNENNKVKEYKAYKVKALDTTAAGDSFLGGFISKLCEKVDLDEMIKYATAVSAITVTRKGAQDSIPNKEEVEKFLFENHNM
ncbi:MAG: ribokinase, partial [Leptotrichiaceae bacterium]|nr:ribokinase [Leptotrichiaceae bacterium]MBP9630384.1 ribokinase [Leptotrichiaceae bacterium]